MVDLSEFEALLDDSPFEEMPVDLDTFIGVGNGYLVGDKESDKFELSPIQRDLVESMSQIYKLEDVQRIHGGEAGIQHFKRYTKKEVIMQLGKGSSRGSDEVYLSDTGKWVRIDSLQSSPNNSVVGSHNGSVVSQYATESFIEGYDVIWEVEFERGLTMGVTMDHSFYDRDFNRVQLKDLSIGDRVAISARTVIDNPVPLDEHEAKLLGYWIGDGTMPTDLPRGRMLNVDFGDGDGMAQAEYLSILNGYGDNPRLTIHPNGKAMSCVRSHKDEMALTIAAKHGLWGKRARDKSIPEAIWSAPDHQVSEFISRLWGCDGTVYMKRSGSKSHGVLEYSTVSKDLAVGLQRLLTRFGILASLRSRVPTYTYKGEKRHGQLAHYLTIADKVGVERFASNIRLLDKQSRLDEAVASYADSGSSGLYQGDFFFGRIKAVKEVGPMPVFTMTATQTSNFIQNLVLNGNSGKLPRTSHRQ